LAITLKEMCICPILYLWADTEMQFKILFYFSTGTNFQSVLTVGFVTTTPMFHM